MKYELRKSCSVCHQRVTKEDYFDKHTKCSKNLFGSAYYVPVIANSENYSETKELFGIELELPFPSLYSNRGIENKITDTLVRLKIPAQLGYDGGGIEFRFYPLSFKAYSSFRKKFNSLFNTCKNLKAYESTGAGIHIHISKTAFKNDQHLYKFLKFIYKNKTNVSKLAGRHSETYASFCGSTLKTLKNRAEYTLKPRPESKDYDSYESYMEAYTLWRTQVRGKFRAVNTAHEDTIEVRVFKTTTQVQTFYGYLQFVKALLEFTHRFEASKMTWVTFDKFVGKKRKFKDLRTLITDRLPCV